MLKKFLPVAAIVLVTCANSSADQGVWRVTDIESHVAMCHATAEDVWDCIDSGVQTWGPMEGTHSW